MNPNDENEVKWLILCVSSRLVMLFILAGDSQLRIVFFHSHILGFFGGGFYGKVFCESEAGR